MEELKFLPGFVRNEGQKAYFRLQHSLPPQAKLSLEQAFLAVGAKSGFNRGPEFIQWLKDNYFASSEWGFYSGAGEAILVTSENAAQSSEATLAETPSPVSSTSPNLKAKGAGRNLRRKNPKVDKNKITPLQIVEADFEKAKSLIESCKDKVVLKKAMFLSSHLAHKEEHQRYLMRRLEQV